MENLLSILDSFQPGWKEKEYLNDLITILREMVIPGYPFLEAKIENNKAVFPKEWDQIISAFRAGAYFRTLCAPCLWRSKNL